MARRARSHLGGGIRPLAHASRSDGEAEVGDAGEFGGARISGLHLGQAAMIRSNI